MKFGFLFFLFEIFADDACLFTCTFSLKEIEIIRKIYLRCNIVEPTFWIAFSHDFHNPLFPIPMHIEKTEEYLQLLFFYIFQHHKLILKDEFLTTQKWDISILKDFKKLSYELIEELKKKHFECIHNDRNNIRYLYRDDKDFRNFLISKFTNFLDCCIRKTHEEDFFTIYVKYWLSYFKYKIKTKKFFRQLRFLENNDNLNYHESLNKILIENYNPKKKQKLFILTNKYIHILKSFFNTIDTEKINEYIENSEIVQIKDEIVKNVIKETEDFLKSSQMDLREQNKGGYLEINIINFENFSILSNDHDDFLQKAIQDCIDSIFSKFLSYNPSSLMKLDSKYDFKVNSESEEKKNNIFLPFLHKFSKTNTEIKILGVYIKKTRPFFLFYQKYINEIQNFHEKDIFLLNFVKCGIENMESSGYTTIETYLNSSKPEFDLDLNYDVQKTGFLKYFCFIICKEFIISFKHFKMDELLKTIFEDTEINTKDLIYDGICIYMVNLRHKEFSIPKKSNSCQISQGLDSIKLFLDNKNLCDIWELILDFWLVSEPPLDTKSQNQKAYETFLKFNDMAVLHFLNYIAPLIKNHRFFVKKLKKYMDENLVKDPEMETEKSLKKSGKQNTISITNDSETTMDICFTSVRRESFKRNMQKPSEILYFSSIKNKKIVDLSVEDRKKSQLHSDFCQNQKITSNNTQTYEIDESEPSQKHESRKKTKKRRVRHSKKNEINLSCNKNSNKKTPENLSGSELVSENKKEPISNEYQKTQDIFASDLQDESCKKNNEPTKVDTIDLSNNIFIKTKNKRSEIKSTLKKSKIKLSAILDVNKKHMSMKSNQKNIEKNKKSEYSVFDSTEICLNKTSESEQSGLENDFNPYSTFFSKKKKHFYNQKKVVSKSKDVINIKNNPHKKAFRPSKETHKSNDAIEKIYQNIPLEIREEKSHSEERIQKNLDKNIFSNSNQKTKISSEIQNTNTQPCKSSEIMLQNMLCKNCMIKNQQTEKCSEKGKVSNKFLDNPSPYENINLDLSVLNITYKDSFTPKKAYIEFLKAQFKIQHSNPMTKVFCNCEKLVYIDQPKTHASKYIYDEKSMLLEKSSTKTSYIHQIDFTCIMFLTDLGRMFLLNKKSSEIPSETDHDNKQVFLQASNFSEAPKFVKKKFHLAINDHHTLCINFIYQNRMVIDNFAIGLNPKSLNIINYDQKNLLSLKIGLSLILTPEKTNQSLLKESFMNKTWNSDFLKNEEQKKNSENIITLEKSKNVDNYLNNKGVGSRYIYLDSLNTLLKNFFDHISDKNYPFEKEKLYKYFMHWMLYRYSEFTIECDSSKVFHIFDQDYEDGFIFYIKNKSKEFFQKDTTLEKYSIFYITSLIDFEIESDKISSTSTYNHIIACFFVQSSSLNRLDNRYDIQSVINKEKDSNPSNIQNEVNQSNYHSNYLQLKNDTSNNKLLINMSNKIDVQNCVEGGFIETKSTGSLLASNPQTEDHKKSTSKNNSTNPCKNLQILDKCPVSKKSITILSRSVKEDAREIIDSKIKSPVPINESVEMGKEGFQKSSHSGIKKIDGFTQTDKIAKSGLKNDDGYGSSSDVSIQILQEKDKDIASSLHSTNVAHEKNTSRNLMDDKKVKHDISHQKSTKTPKFENYSSQNNKSRGFYREKYYYKPENKNFHRNDSGHMHHNKNNFRDNLSKNCTPPNTNVYNQTTTPTHFTNQQPNFLPGNIEQPPPILQVNLNVNLYPQDMNQMITQPLPPPPNILQQFAPIPIIVSHPMLYTPDTNQNFSHSTMEQQNNYYVAQDNQHKIQDSDINSVQPVIYSSSQPQYAYPMAKFSSQIPNNSFDTLQGNLPNNKTSLGNTE